MKTRTRFAPSPTGYLHVGNVRAALFCYLYAKSAGGEAGDFILRLDDTDSARSTPAFAEAIREDLQWLGLTYDEEACQSDRFGRYDAVFQDLRERGLVYPAYETPEELERKRKRQLSRGQPPLYDRAALALTDGERNALEAEGRHPHWRFKLSGARITWQDMVRGEQHIETASLSDPVLLRGDGTWLYTLPSVVDDMDMNITHIIRGEDHVSNTAVQIELMEAIGAPQAIFGHFSLMLSASGEGLSKRAGSQGVR
ncbi:MAG: glutamate--tRNA ligase, partial [Alphaproteobacteria bacterium]|nr:glutamate--tRNA ligase [Alphaproteobacteria bacterium]